MLAWLLCFVAGGYAASQLTSRLSYDFSLPGQPAYETGVTILKLYGNGGNTTPSVLVITVPAGQRLHILPCMGRLSQSSQSDTLR